MYFDYLPGDLIGGDNIFDPFLFDDTVFEDKSLDSSLYDLFSACDVDNLLPRFYLARSVRDCFTDSVHTEFFCGSVSGHYVNSVLWVPSDFVCTVTLLSFSSSHSAQWLLDYFLSRGVHCELISSL